MNSWEKLILFGLLFSISADCEDADTVISTIHSLISELLALTCFVCAFFAFKADA